MVDIKHRFEDYLRIFHTKDKHKISTISILRYGEKKTINIDLPREVYELYEANVAYVNEILPEVYEFLIKKLEKNSSHINIIELGLINNRDKTIFHCDYYIFDFKLNWATL
jgi:hypothetical protein